jgi:polyphosphate kinase
LLALFRVSTPTFYLLFTHFRQDWRVFNPEASRFTDRELSWLDFNQRVLEMAEDKEIPLLERIRFLAIFTSNLDEFFMVRVASLKRKIEAGVGNVNSAGFVPREQMKVLLKRTHELVERQSKCFHSDLIPELSKVGVNFLTWDELTESELVYLQDLFTSKIYPVLTPLGVDPAHPFPHISGLSLNIGIQLRNPDSREEFFARVKIPLNLPRFIATSDGAKNRYIPLELLIRKNLNHLFPGMEILTHYTFRLTRNQDMELDEEETDDILLTLEKELQKRRFGTPVRLEVPLDIPAKVLADLADELEIDESEIIKYQEPLDLTGLNQIADIEIAHLKFPPFSSSIPPQFEELEDDSPEEFFAALRHGEVLLHHPYDSFTNTVVKFLESATADPHVLAIKQTLYRTSGDSPIVNALIEAAEAGKQVLAVVEIRARFDEMANMKWARKLEDAGVHVVYGLLGLKTHAKLSLVVREEPSGIRRYCHVGTGNYNPKTARFYDDFGLLSADFSLCDDLTKLFNQLSGFAPSTTYARLLVAPKTLRTGILERIQNEINNHSAGKPSGIRFKLNSLLDEEIIEALYKASAIGVPVKLVVRGICALKAGVPGLSENIVVRSVLGRFLEHTRIYNFVSAGSNEYWIGSADLMHRNLDRRIESLIRVERMDHKLELDQAMSEDLSDDLSTWHLVEGDKWRRKVSDTSGKRLQTPQEVMINRKRRLYS